MIVDSRRLCHKLSTVNYQLSTKIMIKNITPYGSPENKKEQVAQMFDNIAHRYDFLNRFLSLGIDKLWRKQLISQILTNNPNLVLDVATGTGDVAINTVKKQNKINPKNSLKIIGVDISPEMLKLGRIKINASHLAEKITFIDGDSENLHFENNKFDVVSVAYGVRNFENLELGISEIFRVLKPGGKIAVLEFSRPLIFPIKQIFNFYFKNILPFIGSITSKDNRAYAYLYESVQEFPEGENFVKILEKTGFTQATCKSLSFGISSLYIAHKV